MLVYLLLKTDLSLFSTDKKDLLSEKVLFFDYNEATLLNIKSILFLSKEEFTYKVVDVRFLLFLKSAINPASVKIFTNLALLSFSVFKGSP